MTSCAWKTATAGPIPTYPNSRTSHSMDTQVTLSERLVERQLISSEELERVMKLQQEQQAPLTRLVVELGFL